jgi:hypothetical protein
MKEIPQSTAAFGERLEAATVPVDERLLLRA